MKLKKILLTAFSVVFLCGINEQTQAAKAYSTVSPIVNKIVNDRNDKFTLEWTYPEVIIPGNTAAEEKINAYFRNAYNKGEKEYLAKQGTDDITSISENYEVSVNTKKYLIFRITGMTYAYHAAHPLSWDYSIAFRVSDGKKLTWQDLISSQDKDKVSLAALNRRLAVHPLANSFFPVKNKMHPYAGAYFVDKNQEFHFLYGQYEIGPYAIGFVDVPMGVKIK
jgi:hypothetical protein